MSTPILAEFSLATSSGEQARATKAIGNTYIFTVNHSPGGPITTAQTLGATAAISFDDDDNRRPAASWITFI